MAAQLTVHCLGMSFQNPVLVASGTFGYGDEYYDIMPFSRLGGLVTKTVTAAPRQGNPPPRIVETDCGMLNSIGLANVGLKVFIREKLPWILQHAAQARVVVNFAGFSVDEFVEVGTRLGQCRGIDALEVNLGCPNIKAGYIHFGADAAVVREVIGGLRRNVRLPLAAKLSPNVTDIAALAETAVQAGADAVSLINTLPGMKIGGIGSGSDALEYIMAGARLVQVGTANFVHPQAASLVLDELAGYCEKEGVSDISDLVGLAHEQ